MKPVLFTLPIIFGFIIDLFLGDPYSLPHPVRLIGTMISQLENAVRKRFAGNLKAGGTVLSIIVLTASTAVPFLILLAFYYINLWLGIIAESVMCYYLIAPKCLRDESMKVYYAIKQNDVEKARRLFP